jgi:hypothetical protein
MAGFVVFCMLVAALVENAGVAMTFITAAAGALCTQGALAWASTRSAPTDRAAGLARSAAT